MGFPRVLRIESLDAIMVPCYHGTMRTNEVCDLLADDELFARFESALIPNKEYRHREHVRTAFIYLSRYPDLAEAALYFRRALRRYAAAQGVPQLFHETLTWAYLALINQHMRQGGGTGSAEFLSRNPDLLSHREGLLARYYDVGAITSSPLAREVFVLPGGKGR
jgi:hypothetical protein